MVAPITPPMSACDELDGMPKYQVSRFQMIPPARPASTTVRVTKSVSTRPLAIVAATASDRKAPTRFSTPDRATAVRGPERARGDRGRHGVACVMESVGEVESEGDYDDQDKQRIIAHAPRFSAGLSFVEILPRH